MLISRRKHYEEIETIGSVLAVFMLVSAFAAWVFAGDLEPPADPAPTIQVAKTGRETSFATGDDGKKKRGSAWPVPQFTNNGDGTVMDNLTGLIWLQNANRFGIRTWTDALADCNSLADDGVA